MARHAVVHDRFASEELDHELVHVRLRRESVALAHVEFAANACEVADVALARQDFFAFRLRTVWETDSLGSEIAFDPAGRGVNLAITPYWSCVTCWFTCH